MRLVLELAATLGLLDLLGPDVRPDPSFAAWRDTPPAEQFAAAVQAWWTLGHVPTRARGDDGKAQRALVHDGARCELCTLARHTMLEVLTTGAHEAAPTTRATAAARVGWWRPAAHQGPDDVPLAEHWREAELLGVIAGGGLTPVGQALLEERDVRTVAEALLPAATEQATFGSDLTVFVAGFPAARVSAVLDSAADREGRGGAVTWRFTPASVRRAFDEGADAESLLAELAAVSTAELPQPLRYLVADVARRHGSLRLSAATSIIRSDDVALLASVAADRTLAKHGLRLLAPTVLAADLAVPALLAAIRSAGYLPVVEGDVVAGEAPNRPRPATRRPLKPQETSRAQEQDWDALAARIIAGKPERRGTTSTTEKVLSRLNRTLSAGELRQLARAIDQRGRIGIDYVAATGRGTRRVIAEPELLGTSLIAWCELRNDEREFTISRIVSVQPL